MDRPDEGGQPDHDVQNPKEGEDWEKVNPRPQPKGPPQGPPPGPPPPPK